MPQAVNIGTNTNTTGATIAVTVGAAGVPAGSLILVGVTEKSTTGVNGSLADTATNTWNTSQSGNLAATAADGRGMVFFAFNSKALVNGNTITYTKNTSGSICAISACYFGPDVVVAANPEDTAARASATGTTGTITVTSGAPAHPNDLFVGVLCDSGTSTAGGNATFTQAASPWATPPNEANSGGSGNARVNGGWRLGSGTSTQAYNPSLSSTAQQWALFITAFQLDLEPNPHFLGRFTAPVHARFRYNSAVDVPQVATSSSTFVVGFDDGYLSSRSIAPLYQQPSTDVLVAVVQPETNPHFIGRFQAPVHARFAYNTVWDAAVPQPATNTNFLGRFTAPAHTVLPALRQNSDTLFNPETNVSFIGRFAAPTHAILPALRQNLPPAFAAETNPHFIGRYQAPTHARFNYNTAWDSRVPQAETNISFLGRFAATTHAIGPQLRFGSDPNVPTVVAQPETNISFLGRFTVPVHARFNYNFAPDVPVPTTWVSTVVVAFDDGYPAPPQIAPLYQQPAGDVPAAVVQPETNPHFLGTFEAYTHALLSSFRQGTTDGTAVETNPHFVGRFGATVFTLLPALRQNAATDFIVTAATAETQPHFLGRFTAPTYARFNYSSRADAPPVAETNISFIGRHQPTAHQLNVLARQNSATDFVSVAISETNTHFLGRFSPTTHQILRSFRETTLSADTQRETNPHFIGRYTAPVHARFRYSTVWDSRVPQAETNPHFLGRHTPAAHKINILARQNAALDVPPQPETNVHFLGRYQAPVHARFAYNTWDTRVPQAETNPHTIGRFTPAKITVLPALRQAPALDVPRPEQNPHFIGRYTAPTHQVLRSLLGNLGGDRIIVPNVEAQPHFIGRHTPTVHARSIYHLERQGVTLIQVAEAKSILTAFIASTALAAETATSTLAAKRAASTLDRNR